MTVAGLLQGLATVGAMAGGIGFLAGKTITSNDPLEAGREPSIQQEGDRLPTTAELMAYIKKVK